MAGQENDELLLDKQVEGEDPDTDDQGQDQDQDDDGNVSDEFVEEVVFGDEAAPASGESDTGLVKHLREQIRERDKRLAELSKAQPQQQELGPKPTLETCEYDEERFEAELERWHDQKRKADEVQQAQGNVQRQAREEWDRDYQGYQQKRAALAFADRDEVESIATATLNEVQQAVIVQAAGDPALLLYALGKNPAKLAEISKITNPLKMAVAVAKLEGDLKVNRKRKAPDPERIETGSARVAQKGPDKELERLEKEAERTGDRTKVIAYKAKLKARA